MEVKLSCAVNILLFSYPHHLSPNNVKIRNGVRISGSSRLDLFCSAHTSFVLPNLPEAIEVLFVTGAFVVKRVCGKSQSEGEKPQLGQLTWSKYGGASKCWAVAKERANVDV